MAYLVSCSQYNKIEELNNLTKSFYKHHEYYCQSMGYEKHDDGYIRCNIKG